jgi:DNA (cytosine-5)-methyltransferase 1
MRCAITPMHAYYNEIDPYAAQWLRNLIARGLIAPGDVDERSILEVSRDDLRDYTQCHFFAGLGGWSYALRLAGWPDDRPVWTGSCPCQPFSTAGKQRGSEDERHLWPAFFDLIRERRPASVFGEQVAGAAGLAWLDHVCADLEGAGYAAAAANLCAAGAGAPHIRQRLYWVAHAEHAERRTFDVDQQNGCDGPNGRRQEAHGVARTCGEVRGLADADGWNASAERQQRGGEQRLQPQDGGACLLGDAGDEGLEIERRFPGVSRGASGSGEGQAAERTSASTRGVGSASDSGPQKQHGRRHEPARPSETDRLAAWADLEWLACSDGKARPTQPGLFPLAHGIPNRMGRLRAYGNAIVPQVAAVFVMANVELSR